MIGGSQIFKEALPFARQAFVTRIRATVDADTYAPDMRALTDSGLWKLADVTPWMLPKHPENGIREYRFETYRKIDGATEDDEAL